MSAPMLLSVATFGRVFDVVPAVDALTIDELAEALSRFQLKGELARREERDLERAREAQRAHLAGETLGGPMPKRFQRHLKRHEGAASAEEAAKGALADLERDIRREAKQDLRLWAPTLFAPGERREDGNVVHLSALVFDFDRGPMPDELRAVFADVLHMAHSTWSHTPEHPKLRLIIPFSAPVRPADYHAIWHYADERTGKLADPTGRALARAWALPAVPSSDRERMAWTHPGPLFDPFALGLAATPDETPIPPPTHASFLRRDPGEIYLAPTAAPPEPTVAPGEDAGFDPWDGGAPPPDTAAVSAPPPVPAIDTTSVSAPPPVPATDTTPVPAPALSLEARVAALEARVEALEKLLSAG